MLAHPVDEVGADAGHEREAVVARHRDERVAELGTRAGIVTRGPQLLERVDDHDVVFRRRRGPRGREGARRVGARCDGGGRPRARFPQHAGPECRQEPGLDERRLPAARRADDDHDRRARDARDELGEELVATEEQVGVVGVERFEAPVGDPHGRRIGDDRRELHLALLDEALQALDPVGEVAARRHESDPCFRRALRGGVHLPARRLLRPLARDPVHRERHATGLGEELVDLAVAPRAAVDRRDVTHLVSRERPQDDAPGSGLAVVVVVGPEGRHHEERRARRPLGEVGEGFDGRGVGDVQIVEREKDWTSAAP